ncbi:uncharacterized protein LOC134537885 isoform X2 [Bacillus rossius redtenbacheri]
MEQKPVVETEFVKVDSIKEEVEEETPLAGVQPAAVWQEEMEQKPVVEMEFVCVDSIKEEVEEETPLAGVQPAAVWQMWWSKTFSTMEVVRLYIYFHLFRTGDTNNLSTSVQIGQDQTYIQGISVVSVINRYFNNSYFIAFYNVHLPPNSLIDFILSHIQMKIHIPILHIYDFETDKMYDAFSRSETTENNIGYIVLSDFNSEVCLPTYNWTILPFWNPQALFLLIITDNSVNKKEQFSGKLQDCWDTYNILNIAIVYYKGFIRNNNVFISTKVVTYNPFMEKIYEAEIGIEEPKGNFDVYPQKIHDTNGYQFYISSGPVHEQVEIINEKDGTVNYVGPSSLATYSAIKKFNGSMKMLPVSHSIRIQDHKFSKILYADEAAYVWPLTKWYTYPHEWSCITCVVPKANMIPKYWNITMPLTSFIWLLYLITFTIVGVFSKLVDHYGNKFQGNTNICFEIFRIAVSGGSEAISNSFTQRTINMMAIFLHIMVASAYQGSLTTFLFKTHFFPDINNYDQFVETDLKMSAFISLDDLFGVIDSLNNESPLFNTFLERAVLITENSEALDMVANHRNICRIMPRITAVHDVSQPRYYKNGYPMLHVMNDLCFNVLMTHWVMTPNNPFLAQFSDVIVHLMEGGFIYKWRLDYTEQSRKMASMSKYGDYLTPVSLYLITIPFVVMCFGMLLSVVTLACEIVYSNVTARNPKK